MDHSDSVAAVLEELRREVKSLQRDLYGNPQIRQRGVFDRLEGLEEKLSELKATYEREKIEEGILGHLEADVAQLKLDYRVALVFLKGIGATTGAIFVTVMASIVVAIFRLWGGG